MPDCYAKNCKSRRTQIRKNKNQLRWEKSHGNISFHRIPKDPLERKKWLDKMGLDASNVPETAALCSLHFNEKDLDRTSLNCTRLHPGAVPFISVSVPFQRPRLDSTALPTIFNGDKNTNPPISITAEPKVDPKHDIEAKSLADERNETPVCTTGKVIVPYRRVEPSNLTEHSYSAKSTVSPLEKQYFHIATKVPNVTVSSEVEHKTNVQEFSSMDEPSMPKSSTRNTREWEFSSVIIHERESVDPRVANDENKKISSAEIPQSWSISQLSRGPDQKILFSHARAIMRNEETTPIILKCVTLRNDGVLRYYVYGRLVNIQEGQHLRILEKTSDLPRVLERFERANVCNGIGSVDVFQLRTDQVFQDYFEQWHHNACSLLSRTRRCKNCAHIRKMQLQREARSRKGNTPCRIRSALNPMEEKKLAAIRKRNECLRRAKNRAQLRMNLLLESLKKSERPSRKETQTFVEHSVGLNVS